MRLKRKLISLTLALCLLFSCVTVSRAEFRYSDWFRNSYLEMLNMGLVPEEFSDLDLTRPITRQEMCVAAVTALEAITGNHIETPQASPFSDTGDESILRAKELGIVNGYTDGTFRPENHLTRQEFFQIVLNFCRAAAFQPNAVGASIESFPDSGTVADWARDAALICVKYGYVNGSLENGVAKLKPKSDISRQEAMTMLLRCFKGLSEFYYHVSNATVIALSNTGSGVSMVGEAIVTDATGTMYVNADELNIRSGPGTTYTLLGTLQRGMKVVITGVCSNQWFRINHRGTVCYVASQHLSPEAGSASIASNIAVQICNEAMKYLGYPYVWGGTSPKQGFDCSGLVYYVFEKFGYKLNRVADDQMDQGTQVTKDQLLAGDLVFFGYGKYADHVGIYIGNGNFLHAANPKAGVKISSMSETYYANKYLCAKRIVTK